MKKNWLLLLFLLVIPVIYFSCSKSTTTTTLVGNWSSAGQVKGDARSGAVCFTIGDTVYIGLGYNPTSTPTRYLTDFYKFIPKTSQRIAIAPFIGSGRSGAVAFSVNGKGYVGTGYDGNNYCNDFYEYDPALNQWKKVAQLSNFGRRNAVAFAIGNNGYVGTGYSGHYLGDFWKFTPSADSGSWSAINDLLYNRANGVAFVMNNKGYVVTGDDNNTYTDRFFSYDPSTQVWTELRRIANVSTDTYDDSYNIVRSNAVAFVDETLGKAYITCGTTSGARSDTWEYDPSNDTWLQKTSFEGAARSEAVGFSISNRLFVATGRNGSSYFDDVWEFKPNDTYDANN